MRRKVFNQKLKHFWSNKVQKVRKMRDLERSKNKFLGLIQADLGLTRLKPYKILTMRLKYRIRFQEFNQKWGFHRSNQKNWFRLVKAKMIWEPSITAILARNHLSTCPNLAKAYTPKAPGGGYKSWVSIKTIWYTKKGFWKGEVSSREILIELLLRWCMKGRARCLSIQWQTLTTTSNIPWYNLRWCNKINILWCTHKISTHISNLTLCSLFQMARCRIIKNYRICWCTKLSKLKSLSIRLTK